MRIADTRLDLIHWVLIWAAVTSGCLMLGRAGALDQRRPAALPSSPGSPKTAQQQNGSVYYVDATTGSDANSGSRAQPWKTIQQAARVVEAGDTVYVRSGRYPERVQISRGGTAGAPIVFAASGQVMTRGFTVRADHVTIRGFEITDTPNVWDDGVGIFVAGSDCLLENNYVHFATRGGILLFGYQGEEDGSNDCVVRNNRLFRNGMMGIEIHGRGHVVQGNEIWRTIQYHPKWVPAPNWLDADGIRFFGSGHAIRDNYIHDITFADPENVNPHIDCFQTWGPAYDIVFDGNVCNVLEYQSRTERGKGFMIEEQYGPVRDLTIVNNVIQAFNHVTAIDAEGLRILNNTFIGNSTFPAWALGSVEFFRSPGATVQNNAFYNLQNEHIAADAASLQGWNVSHNGIYRSDGQLPSGAPAPGDVWNRDPRFCNPAKNDFRLQSNSPLIDAGASVDVTIDATGEPRPEGRGYDIGAYEYRLPSCDTIVTPAAVPSPTPEIDSILPTLSPTRTIPWRFPDLRQPR